MLESLDVLPNNIMLRTLLQALVYIYNTTLYEYSTGQDALYLRIIICICACMYACVCVCVYVCVYMCVCCVNVPLHMHGSSSELGVL